MTTLDIIQKAIPAASEELANYIVMCRTAFPFERITTRELYRTARRFDRAHRNKVQLCDFCDNKAEIGELCHKCAEALHAGLPPEKE